jgi:Protein of unknown function (DUF2961)
MTTPTLRGDLAVLRDVQSRAITAENPTGARGAGGRATEGTGAHAARDLGVGWKVSPSIMLAAGATVELGSIEGPGVIEHIWCTTRVEAWRSLILRISWDGDDGPPAVAVPLGDFFCLGWNAYSPLSSELITVAPNGGLNAYFPMPFQRSARVSIENLSPHDLPFYYQIDYTLGEVADNSGYLHAAWHRSNPVPAGEVHTILDGATGRGRYIGTYLAMGINGDGWWGEGELKFYFDGETDPTICGTGTEDYFGGAWNFDVPGQGYTTFNGPYCGLHQFLPPDGLYRAQPRFGMYRWHVPDTVAFGSGIKVTLQDLGWKRDGRYLLRSDDIASVAYWYSDDPTGAEGTPMTLDSLEVRG